MGSWLGSVVQAGGGGVWGCWCHGFRGRWEKVTVVRRLRSSRHSRCEHIWEHVIRCSTTDRWRI